MNKRTALRRSILLTALAATLPLATVVSAQENYPARAVKIVVPYPPGGTTDLLARALSVRLTSALNQTVIVENKPGAGGAIGAAHVARSTPDGYTLLMGTVATHGINPVVAQVAYDPIKDFKPITNVADTPNVLTVNVDTPYKTLSDILNAARARPGGLSFGSTSHGGSPHMSGELLKTLANVDMVHVAYKGGGPMLNDLIGGQIPLGFDNLPSSMPHIRSGKVRPIAVTTSKRWPGAPEIPTMAESGVPGYEVSAWFGLLAPAGTPDAVVNLLHRTVAEILREPEMARQLLELGAQPVANTPQAFARAIETDLQKWRKVAKTAGFN